MRHCSHFLTHFSLVSHAFFTFCAGEAQSESEEEGAEEEEEEEIILEDDLLVLQSETTEAQQTVTLPSHKMYIGLPKELAPVALAVWDFASAMRRRILSQASLGTYSEPS